MSQRSFTEMERDTKKCTTGSEPFFDQLDTPMLSKHINATQENGLPLQEGSNNDATMAERIKPGARQEVERTFFYIIRMFGYSKAHYG